MELEQKERGEINRGLLALLIISHSHYRVIHLLCDLGWVEFDISCSTVCPVLLGLMGIWQKWLGSWVSRWNIEFKVKPTQVSEQMKHPVNKKLGWFR